MTQGSAPVSDRPRESPVPEQRPFSPWWLLLIAPMILGVGWLAGRMPGPGRSEPMVSIAPVSAPVPAGGGEAPAPAQRTPASHPTIVYSEWTSYDDAIRQSRDNGKPLLLDFSADWCGPCQMLKREVFENEAAAATVKSAVIPVSLVDCVREQGENPPALDQLQRRFDVQAFPTLVVFSPGTGRYAKRVGFAGGAETLSWITETVARLD